MELVNASIDIRPASPEPHLLRPSRSGSPRASTHREIEQKSPRGGSKLGTGRQHPSISILSPHYQLLRTTKPYNDDDTEDYWVEMQNTLQEVELNAANSTIGFGAEHSKALEELRLAHISLAQTLAKSAESEDTRIPTKVGDPPAEVPSTANLFSSEPFQETTNTTIEPPLGDGPHGSREKSRLEKETEKDINLARRRRAANDQYFRRVNKGVHNVLQKLGEVEKAIKWVELESKEIMDVSTGSDNETSGPNGSEA